MLALIQKRTTRANLLDMVCGTRRGGLTLVVAGEQLQSRLEGKFEVTDMIIISLFMGLYLADNACQRFVGKDCHIFV